MAKQHKLGSGSKRIMDQPERFMAIRCDDDYPGSTISMNQWVSCTPGQLPHTKGKVGAANQYHRGTLFYNHYSTYIHVECQVSLRVEETVEGKH